MLAYSKAFVALTTAALVALQVSLADGGVTGAEWVTVALAVLGAAGVWATPNTSPPAVSD